MKRTTIVEIIAVLLILLFVYAAISKFLDYPSFRLQLGKSPIISPFSAYVAWGIPLTEILVSIMLATNKLRTVGLYASMFLMTLFTAYIYAILNYSYYIPCSCGGILSKMGWTTHFWFNIMFVILSILGILVEEEKVTPNSKRFVQETYTPLYT